MEEQRRVEAPVRRCERTEDLVGKPIEKCHRCLSIGA
jgi:hypothetical protein